MRSTSLVPSSLPRRSSPPPCEPPASAPSSSPGGGFADHPIPALATVSLGKAALRSAATMLGADLAPDGIRVATLTIAGQIIAGTSFDPGAHRRALRSEGWAGPSCRASSRSTVGNASTCSTTSMALNSSRGTATGARRPGTRTVTANTPSRPRCTRSSTTSTTAGSRSVRSPADGWLASVSSCHTFGPGSRSWHSSTSAHRCVRRVSAAVCPSSSSRSPAPPATPTWSSRRRHRRTPCGSTSVAAFSPWRIRWPSCSNSILAVLGGLSPLDQPVDLVGVGVPPLAHPILEPR